MTIFYETGRYDKTIVPVEVEKATDKSVWIDERRRPKRSGWRNYFESESEAWDFLISEAEKSFEKCNQRAIFAKGKLASIRAARELQTNA